VPTASTSMPTRLPSALYRPGLIAVYPRKTAAMTVSR
jgi:hypothetical protein